MAKFYCQDNKILIGTDSYPSKVSEIYKKYVTSGLLTDKTEGIKRKSRLLMTTGFFDEYNFDVSASNLNKRLDNFKTEYKKFIDYINTVSNNYFENAKNSEKDLNDTADKNEKQLKEEMDNAYKKWANQSVNSGYDAQRKQALWDEYLKAKKAYEKKTDPLAKYSIDQLAAMVIAGKFGVGEARKKALGSHYDAVQKRVNELMSGYTTKAPQTTAQQRSVSTPKPTTTAPQKTTVKPTTTAPQKTTPKPTTTSPQKTTPKPTTTAPQKTTPTSTAAKPTVTPKPTQEPQQTVAPTPSQDPGGTPTGQGARSKLEEEIKKLREQLEKEQQERLNLQQKIEQQSTQQQPQQQTVQQPAPSYQDSNPTPTVEVGEPEPAVTVEPINPTTVPIETPKPTIAPTELPNPNVGGDTGTGGGSTSKSSGSSVIPIAVGLGAAVAGGIGIKAIHDHKKNSEFDDQNEDSVTNGNRFWTDEDPNVVHSEQDLFSDNSDTLDASYQATENSTADNDTWNIEDNEIEDNNSFDLLSENN